MPVWAQGYARGDLADLRRTSEHAVVPGRRRLEKRGLVQGRWVEKAGQRRRRFYKLTASGKKILVEQRRTWKDFFAALDRVAGINPAR